MGIHGGDVYRNRVELDFSVNTNPLGMPTEVEEALHRAVSVCGRYPDMEAGRLKRAVSQFFGAPEDSLLFGNGASELFMALVHGIRPKKTVIPVPSFYGYEYAAKAAGGGTVYYERKQEDGFGLTGDLCTVLTEDVDLLFLANPNNPTGDLMDQEALRRVLLHCGERGIHVVLDESFIDFCGRQFSMLSETDKFDNLIIVGSFTKLFSIPGVRLGYLICGNPRLLEKTAGQLPEWNLSCFAQEAGLACAGQAGFAARTAAYTDRERRFLEEGLRRRGFRVFPSRANFILLYSGEPLYGRLLEKGVLIRDCANFRGLRRGFYRIAVKSREENERLLSIL